MPTSFSQPTDMTCPRCGHPFRADLYLIVDAAERPDLCGESPPAPKTTVSRELTLASHPSEK